MTFNMIQFQEDLAKKMLGLKSFQRLFDGDPMARSGLSQRGRRRTKRSALAALADEGYNHTQARQIVRDAQDLAALLHNAD